MIAWLTVQAIALLLSGLRVPLWLHAPEVGETLAVQTLVTVQILAASLLFTRLTESWRSTVMTIAGAWPFASFAGLLGNAPISTIACTAAYVTAWVVVLALWNLPLASTTAKLTAASIASAWCAAGPLLLFLGYEYSHVPLPSPTSAHRIALGPLVNAFALINSDGASDKMSPWITLILPGGLALLTLGVKIALKKGRTTRPGTLKQVAD